MYFHGEPFLHWLKCYFSVYVPGCFATREINTKNNTPMSAETVHHSTTYIILYIFNGNIKHVIDAKEVNATAAVDEEKYKCVCYGLV